MRSLVLAATSTTVLVTAAAALSSSEVNGGANIGRAFLVAGAAAVGTALALLFSRERGLPALLIAVGGAVPAALVVLIVVAADDAGMGERLIGSAIFVVVPALLAAAPFALLGRGD